MLIIAVSWPILSVFLYLFRFIFTLFIHPRSASFIMISPSGDILEPPLLQLVLSVVMIEVRCQYRKPSEHSATVTEIIKAVTIWLFLLICLILCDFELRIIYIVC